jgi:hypothetical protein
MAITRKNAGGFGVPDDFAHGGGFSGVGRV